MPIGIDELKGLQTLSKIIIGGEHGFEINKLGEFKNLHGEISILGLDKVQNATYVREANFSHKKLSVLEVVWSDVFDGSRNEVLEKDVLNELEPHSDYLKQLKIVSYGGLEFPTWVGSCSFLQLKQVSILDCKICTSLPALGQLPVLRELFIEGLVGVKVVGMELLGASTKFHSLEVLSFESMSGWEKWSNTSGVVFPCLRQLKIKDCPNLVEVSLGALPSLNNLEIDGCDSGVLRRLVQVASAVTKLIIKRIPRLHDVVWRGIIEYLETVEDLRIEWCNEIRYLWESEAIACKYLVKLRKLVVWNCDRLVSLGEKEEDNCRSNLLTSLKMLEVYSCHNMKSCCCPHNIDKLSIYNCRSVITLSLPPGQKLKSLEIVGCKKLLEREWGGQKMTMLEDIRFIDSQNLKSIIELNSLVHLTKLTIRGCGSLETFPENELPSLTSLKELEIVNCSSMSSSFSCGIWPPKLQTLKIGGLKKPISEWGPQNFPTSLVSLSLNGRNDGASSCSQFSHILPSSLNSLDIDEFEKLESASAGLQHLTSLQHLSIWDCPNMMDLPEMLLPSFLSLTIRRCPKLKESCSERGSYWPLISRIPRIAIRN